MARWLVTVEVEVIEEAETADLAEKQATAQVWQSVFGVDGTLTKMVYCLDEHESEEVREECAECGGRCDRCR